MNFLNSVCLARFGRSTFWNAPCSCCGTVKLPSMLMQSTQRKDVSGKSTLSTLQRKVCYKNHILVSKPALWLQTQVRFKGIPPFHRDIDHPSFDDYRKDAYIDVRKTRWGEGDTKPGFTYVMGFAGGLIAMYGAKTICVILVSYMAAAADVLALASVEVDLSKIAPGACDIIKWRGKPLFVANRTDADIEFEKKTPVESLRDPEGEDIRTQKPQWLIVIGICTHLGCVPMAKTGDYPGGYYCPCHGSHYDNLGRIRKGPAPTNLVVPPYVFTSDTMVLIG